MISMNNYFLFFFLNLNFSEIQLTGLYIYSGSNAIHFENMLLASFAKIEFKIRKEEKELTSLETVRSILLFRRRIVLRR